MSDPFTILGLDRSATKEDVESAFRKLAKKYHPDVSDDPDAQEKFKEINMAKVEALEAIEARSNPFAGGGAWPDDLFEILRKSGVGAGGGGSYRQNWSEMRVMRGITIPLRDAYCGKVVNVNINRYDGTTAEVAEITIPPRCASQYTIRWESAESGKSIDFIVNISPDQDGFYLSGLDLMTFVKVPIIDLIVGAERGLTLLDGSSISVKIPRGMAPSAKLRINGKGMKDQVGRTGSLYIQFEPLMPVDLTDDDAEQLRAIFGRYAAWESK